MTTTSTDHREHTVYRMFDAADRLLYVGVTVNLTKRLRTHRAPSSHTAHFIKQVARITTEVLPDRDAGYAAERAAIMAERPAHNVAYNFADETPEGAMLAVDVVRSIPGLTYRQLDYWCRKGFVAPSVVDASGCGSRRVFSLDDVDRVRALFDAAQVCAWARDGSIWERVLTGEVWFVTVEPHTGEVAA